MIRCTRCGFYDEFNPCDHCARPPLSVRKEGEMSKRGIVRAFVPGAGGRDAEGREFGSDWPVLPVETTTKGVWLTTDRLHASEVGDLLPETDAGLARLLARAVNDLHQRSTPAEWRALLDEVDR
jgi:hypothetical protein